VIGLLRRLSECFGPSGREDRVRELVAAEVGRLADEVRSDALGNLFAVRRGPGPRVALAAHLDQVGVIVTHVGEDGFCRIAPVGGVAPHVLLGQRLAFASGAVAAVAAERRDDPKQELRFDHLYLDPADPGGVRVGDMAVYAPGLAVAGDRAVGPALDDRAGVAVLVETLRALRDGPSACEAWFVFTVQEEVGLRGARTAGFQIEADVALAVDVTLAADTPRAAPLNVRLGGGAAVKLADRSVICHPGVCDALQAAASRAGAPHQLEVLDAGGTDAGALQLAGAGAAAGGVSIPLRHVHTAAETVDLRDLRACVAVLSEFLRQPPAL
jgi:putative aminopeptidase FrvX